MPDEGILWGVECDRSSSLYRRACGRRATSGQREGYSASISLDLCTAWFMLTRSATYMSDSFHLVTKWRAAYRQADLILIGDRRRCERRHSFAACGTARIKSRTEFPSRRADSVIVHIRTVMASTAIGMGKRCQRTRSPLRSSVNLRSASDIRPFCSG